MTDTAFLPFLGAAFATVALVQFAWSTFLSMRANWRDHVARYPLPPFHNKPDDKDQIRVGRHWGTP